MKNKLVRPLIFAAWVVRAQCPDTDPTAPRLDPWSDGLLLWSWRSPGAGAFIMEQSADLKKWTRISRLHSAEPEGRRVNGVAVSLTNAAYYYRVRRDRTPPSIVEQPGPVTLAWNGATNIVVPTLGAVPLNFLWQRNGATVAATNSPELELTALSPAGNYRLIATNCWGAVTSAVFAVTIQPPPNYAPANVVGRVLEVQVESARFPFAAPALYRLNFGTKGLIYTITGLLNVPNSTGTYTYQKLSGATAKATFADSLTGQSEAALTFTSATAGTFVLTKPGLGGQAEGGFAFR